MLERSLGQAEWTAHAQLSLLAKTVSRFSSSMVFLINETLLDAGLHPLKRCPFSYKDAVVEKHYSCSRMESATATALYPHPERCTARDTSAHSGPGEKASIAMQCTLFRGLRLPSGLQPQHIAQVPGVLWALLSDLPFIS